MQPLLKNRMRSLTTTFSIHKRIEGGATCGGEQCTCKTFAFQYPQADRRGCNSIQVMLYTSRGYLSVSTSGSKGVQLLDQTGKITGLLYFQYPQADRRGCNMTYFITCPPRFAAFSIHKRIEGGATLGRAYISSGSVLLSVSTSGSKGVQPFKYFIY